MSEHFADAAQRLGLEKSSERSATGKCPFNDDGNHDLTLRSWKEHLLLECTSGCSPRVMAEAVGLEVEWLSPAQRERASPEQRESRRVADQLVALASEQYEFGVTPDSQSFAVSKTGPRVALLFDQNRAQLTNELSAAYWGRFERVPPNAALVDAMMTLQGRSKAQQPTEVFLRLARVEDSIHYDLGAQDGSAVIVRPSGWELAKSSVLFRRTELTAVQPQPVRGGDLSELQSLLNADEDAFGLIVGYAVAALLPEIERPIAWLNGEHGTGKSTAGEIMVGIVDPSAAPLQAPPGDLPQWGITAAGSHLVAIDNVSKIPPWLSDALCRAVTGEAMVFRRLYTDSGRTVFRFRRSILLTSIDLDALRGDLADRILRLDLAEIPAERRRPKSQLRAAFEDARPRIVGALFDLLARVLTILPSIRLERQTRLGDFEMVLLAVDQVRGTASHRAYLRQRDELAEDVIEGDAVATAVRDLAESDGLWIGTAQQLLGLFRARELLKGVDPRALPRGPRHLSSMLRSALPSLRDVGVLVTPPSARSRSTDRARSRNWRIEAAAAENTGRETGQTVRPSATRPADPANEVGAPVPEVPSHEIVQATVRATVQPEGGPQASTGVPVDGADEVDGPRPDLDCSVAPARRHRPTLRPPCFECGGLEFWECAARDTGGVCSACKPPLPGDRIEWLMARPREAQRA